MPSEIQGLYDRLRRAPFPALGKHVGDFSLYDSLLAGCASRASRGLPVSASEIPVPDDETSRRVAQLRQKNALTEDERMFLEYVDLLEQLSSVLRGLSQS